MKTLTPNDISLQEAIAKIIESHEGEDGIYGFNIEYPYFSKEHDKQLVDIYIWDGEKFVFTFSEPKK